MVATIEPYHLNLEEVRTLVKIADDYKLDMGMHGLSQHFYGHTFLVDFRKRGGLSND